MKNVFIDCGAHRGESVSLFLKKVVDAENYEIHSFECNPSSAKIFKTNHESKTNITLHEKAIWTNDKGAEFYLGSSPGCSLIKSKKSGDLDKENPIFVKSISLSNFFLASCLRLNFFATAVK